MTTATGRDLAQRPRRPPTSLLVPAGIVGAVLVTIWAAAPRPLGIGIDPGAILADATRGTGILAELAQPDFSFLPNTIAPMMETIQMAVIASAIGCGVGLPVAFLASRVTAPSGWVLRLDRAVLNVVRALPDLLYAMVFVAALSIGPLPGILALIFFNVGVLAKLLSETVDAVDPGPIEAARASGATRAQTVRTSVFPQVLPNYVAYSLYIFELNVRASTVIGIVGAGGIGNVLNTQMKFFDYHKVGLVVLELFALVFLIELVSIQLRRRLV